MLEVREVTVRLGGRLLLDAVGFEVAAGEVVAIVGPNGAGKTTLLEVVTGTRGMDHGSIVFDGATLRRFAERGRCFSLLPDNAQLPAELRVRDVTAHALRFRARAIEIVAALHEALEIEALNDAAIGVLSRGEHQRVALFCALAVERPVVVLDEPFGAFDPLKLRDVLAAVRRIADSGVAVVATVHHLEHAARIADKLLILAEGRVLAWGNLATLQSTAGAPGAPLEDVFVELLSRRSHGP